MPVPVVYMNYGKGNQKELVEGRDYTIRYGSNVNKGSGTVTISGIGAYSGTLTKKFAIQARNIKETELKDNHVKAEFAKGGAKPTNVILSYEGKNLINGIDYTLSYKNNKSAPGYGSSKVPAIVIKGKGNFKGTITKTFDIVEKNISKTCILVSDVISTGKKVKYTPGITIYDTDGYKLKAGTDYQNSIKYIYKNNTIIQDAKSKSTILRKAGEEIQKNDIIDTGTTLLATIIPAGSYTGKAVKAEYRVVSNIIANLKQASILKEYTGEEITLNPSDIRLIPGSNTPLGEGDYQIVPGSYRNNHKKGTATVIVRGQGNYGGVKTIRFTIGAKLLQW